MIVDFYNKHKGAVDTVDRRIASYSVKRATRNWMTVVFCYGVDLSLNNSFILYDAINQGWSMIRTVNVYSYRTWEQHSYQHIFNAGNEVHELLWRPKLCSQ